MLKIFTSSAKIIACLSLSCLEHSIQMPPRCRPDAARGERIERTQSLNLRPKIRAKSHESASAHYNLARNPLGQPGLQRLADGRTGPIFLWGGHQHNGRLALCDERPDGGAAAAGRNLAGAKSAGTEAEQAADFTRQRGRLNHARSLGRKPCDSAQNSNPAPGRTAAAVFGNPHRH